MSDSGDSNIGLRAGSPTKPYAPLEASDGLAAGTPPRPYAPMSSPRPPLPPPSNTAHPERSRSRSPSSDVPWQGSRSGSRSPARDELARGDQAVRELAESLGHNIKHQAELLANIGQQHGQRMAQSGQWPPEQLRDMHAERSRSRSRPLTPPPREHPEQQWQQQQQQHTFSEKIQAAYRSASQERSDPGSYAWNGRNGRASTLDAAVAQEMSVLAPADYGHQPPADYRSEAAELTTAAAAAAMKMYTRPEPTVTTVGNEGLIQELQEARDLLVQQKREFDQHSKLLIGSLAAELDAVKEDLAAELQQEREDRQADQQQLQQLRDELAKQKELNASVADRASQEEIDNAVKQINCAVKMASPLSASTESELQGLRAACEDERRKCQSLETELFEVKERLRQEYNKQSTPVESDREKELEQELAQLNAKLNDETEMTKKLMSQANAGAESAHELQRERAVNTKMTAALQEAVDRLTQERDDVAQQFHGAQQTNAELNSALNSAEAAFAALQNELKNAEASKEELQSRLCSQENSKQQDGAPKEQLVHEQAANQELRDKLLFQGELLTKEQSARAVSEAQLKKNVQKCESASTAMREQHRSELSAVKAELAATEEQLAHEKAARSALETELEQRVVSNLEGTCKKLEGMTAQLAKDNTPMPSSKDSTPMPSSKDNTPMSSSKDSTPMSSSSLQPVEGCLNQTNQSASRLNEMQSSQSPTNEGPMAPTVPVAEVFEQVLSPRSVMRPEQATSQTPPARSRGNDRCKHCSGQLTVFVIAPADQFVCDICDSVMSGCAERGSPHFAADLMSCRDCDFDVCRACYTASNQSLPKAQTPDSELRCVAQLAGRVADTISPKITAPDSSDRVVSPGTGVITAMKRMYESEAQTMTSSSNEAKPQQDPDTQMLDQAIADAFMRSPSSSPK